MVSLFRAHFWSSTLLTISVYLGKVEEGDSGGASLGCHNPPICTLQGLVLFQEQLRTLDKRSGWKEVDSLPCY